jgi:hypothetical protein
MLKQEKQKHQKQAAQPKAQTLCSAKINVKVKPNQAMIKPKQVKVNVRVKSE